VRRAEPVTVRLLAPARGVLRPEVAPAALRAGLRGGLLVGPPVRALLGVHGGERLGDVLQLGLLGLDAIEDLDDPAERHHPGAEEERDRHLRLLAGLDHLAEQERSGDAPMAVPIA